MENNYKTKLNDFIFKSSLSKEQKLLWQLFLKISKPEEEEAVYEAVREEPDNLNILTKHLADKIFDMGKDNKKAWEIISKDEKKFAKFMAELC
jgi:hypothetical protein